MAPQIAASILPQYLQLRSPFTKEVQDERTLNIPKQVLNLLIWENYIPGHQGREHINEMTIIVYFFWELAT